MDDLRPSVGKVGVQDFRRGIGAQIHRPQTGFSQGESRRQQFVGLTGGTRAGQNDPRLISTLGETDDPSQHSGDPGVEEERRAHSRPIAKSPGPQSLADDRHHVILSAGGIPQSEDPRHQIIDLDDVPAKHRIDESANRRVGRSNVRIGVVGTAHTITLSNDDGRGTARGDSRRHEPLHASDGSNVGDGVPTMTAGRPLTGSDAIAPIPSSQRRDCCVDSRRDIADREALSHGHNDRTCSAPLHLEEVN